jgi:hypothetical protein
VLQAALLFLVFARVALPLRASLAVPFELELRLPILFSSLALLLLSVLLASLRGLARRLVSFQGALLLLAPPFLLSSPFLRPLFFGCRALPLFSLPPFARAARVFFLAPLLKTSLLFLPFLRCRSLSFLLLATLAGLVLLGLPLLEPALVRFSPLLLLRRSLALLFLALPLARPIQLLLTALFLLSFPCCLALPLLVRGAARRRRCGIAPRVSAVSRVRGPRRENERGANDGTAARATSLSRKDGHAALQ